ncbi:unnamed protein product [Protopolystoma xenopodis]|uniref:Uncharacterized protein n=1 Tax=Protopolystoma xenopodis TaxID=117903 RepID=A0A3S5CPF2_9PLAT|nr:unnamed protein product [Protopolystoma xenopodis]
MPMFCLVVTFQASRLEKADILDMAVNYVRNISTTSQPGWSASLSLCKLSAFFLLLFFVLTRFTDCIMFSLPLRRSHAKKSWLSRNLLLTSTSSESVR